MGNIVDVAGLALTDIVRMVWATLWALALGFILSGVIQEFIPRDGMRRVMGNTSFRATAMASLLGAVSSSCSYAATAMAKSLFVRGADFRSALVFMVASTNLVIELGAAIVVLLGWQFAGGEIAGGIVMVLILGIVGRRAFPDRLTAPARDALLRGEPAFRAATATVPLRRRLVQRDSWAGAAAYTMADLTMVRRELLIGFGVAGVLMAVVPDSLWGALFIRNHGVLTAVENAFIGPLVAVASFVCSVGNIPLAAALWHGGIGFGGVISFIFADLITLPLLLIYRRYYGTALAVRIFLVFWAVMAISGLIVQGAMAALNITVPAAASVGGAADIGLNATTVADVIAIILVIALGRLARQAGRGAPVATHAIDPICGMRVEIAHAPAEATVGDVTTYFCSDHCKAKFLADAGAIPATPAVIPLTVIGHGPKHDH